MAFNPEEPTKPQDLFATFDVDNRLSGLIYKSPDQGSYSRVNGEWFPLGDGANPLGQGAGIVFVSPSFIMEYDARMMYREYISAEQVRDGFGVQPDFGFNPFSE